MLMCNETVTLVRHIRETDGDRYEGTVLNGVSWHAKSAVTETAKGLTAANVFKCRIPDGLLPNGITPRTGG